MGKNTIALIISVLLISASLFYFCFHIVKNQHLYTVKFNPKVYEKKYLASQWVIPESKNPISDEDLYAYSGYKYLNGINPILISPEVPPLGKYLVGLSIQIFNNQRIISIIVALMSLAVITHIVYESTNSLLISSFAVFLTSIHSLFIDQVIHSPQLDIFQLFFLLLFIIFFLIYKKRGAKLFLFSAGLAMGYFISSKFFLASFVIMNLTLFIYYFLSKPKFKKMFIEIIVLNTVSILTYVFTYIGYFFYGGTLRGFLGVQKWIFLFYQSTKIEISKLLGNYFSLIFFNRWRFWSDGYPIIHYQYWSLLWPIIFILGIFSAYKLLKDKKARKNELIILLVSFLSVYNLFLFVTPIYPRYLLLLFVPLNILIAVYLGKVIETKLKTQMLT